MFFIFPELKDLEQKVKETEVQNEEEVASYYRLREQLSLLGKEFHSWLVRPQYLIPFIQPGRLVSVRHRDKDFGWGAVVNFKKNAPKEKENPLNAETTYVVDTLLHVTTESAKSKNTDQLEPFSEADKNNSSDKGEIIVVPVHLNLIQQISSVRIFMPSDLRPRDNRMAVHKTLQEIHRRFAGESGKPLLDPVKDMKITDSAFKQVVKKISAFESRLESHPLHSDPRLGELLESYSAKAAVAKEAEAARVEVKKAKSLLQMSDLKCMKRVLRRLGYCTAADVIEVKGRIACELSSADELLLTEMVFNGLFNGLSPSQSAAILSCFVCDEKSNEMPKLTEALSGPLRLMQEMARRIAK